MRTSRLYDLLWHEAKLASKPNDGTTSLASSPLTESETERNKFAFTPAKLLYNPKSPEEHLLLLPITIINPRKDYTGPSLDTSVVNDHASPIRHSATGNGPAEPNTTSAVSSSEADLELEHKKFAFTPDQLRKLYNRTILGAFYALGGIDGIEKGLRTDRPAGDSLKKIKTRFARNLYEETSLTASPTASQPISSSKGIQSTKWKTRRSAKSLVSSFSSSTPSALGRVLPFAFFGSAYAQDAPTAESSWRQRALAALTEPVVALAYLLIPAIVLFITGYMAHHYHKKAREGKAGIGMLIMAIILISLLKPSSTATASEKYWRLAIGLAYALFMIVYCRLIALRNKWQRGSCSIVVTLAVLMAFVPMASPSVQTWWDSLTKAHPLFALSPALPLAFTVCDLAAYVAGGMNGRGDGRSGLPPPVPGPQGS
jgi:hypothetical protein